MKYTEIDVMALDALVPEELRLLPYKIVYRDGSIGYQADGGWHKVDGPSCIVPSGRLYWDIGNKTLTETQFLKTSLVGKELLSNEEN